MSDALQDKTKASLKISERSFSKRKTEFLSVEILEHANKISLSFFVSKAFMIS